MNQDKLRETLIDHIETAIKEHCRGCDMYMSALREVLADALSVCRSVSISRDRRIVRDGCVLYAQTEEWCKWLETEIGPKIEQALAASKPKPQAQAEEPEHDNEWEQRWPNAETPPPFKGPEIVTHLVKIKTKDAGMVTFFTAPSDPRGFAVMRVQDHIEAIAKKDAALDACVEAGRIVRLCIPPAQRPIFDAAITQAQEARKS